MEKVGNETMSGNETVSGTFWAVRCDIALTAWASELPILQLWDASVT